MESSCLGERPTAASLPTRRPDVELKDREHRRGPARYSPPQPGHPEPLLARSVPEYAQQSQPVATNVASCDARPSSPESNCNPVKNWPIDQEVQLEWPIESGQQERWREKMHKHAVDE